MNNARTIMHHLERIAAAAGVDLYGDAHAELADAFESIDQELTWLRNEVRELRKLTSPPPAAMPAASSTR